jgi:hypothetical protein
MCALAPLISPAGKLTAAYGNTESASEAAAACRRARVILAGLKRAFCTSGAIYNLVHLPVHIKRELPENIEITISREREEKRFLCGEFAYKTLVWERERASELPLTSFRVCEHGLEAIRKTIITFSLGAWPGLRAAQAGVWDSCETNLKAPLDEVMEV